MKAGLVTGRMPRRRRRGTVAGMYAAFLLAAGLVFAAPEGTAWKVVAGAAFAVAGLAMLGLVTTTRPLVGQLDDATLDERERAVRDAAWRSAYRVLAAAVVLGALYLFLGSGGVFPLPDTQMERNVAFWAALLLATSLPTAVIAWTEPDLPEDDAPRRETKFRAVA